MKTISVSNDIVPVGELKAGISKWFGNLRSSGHPLIITQNGKPAGVLLSSRDYDELVYRKSFVDSVERGISDADSGRVYTTEEIRVALTSRKGRE